MTKLKRKIVKMTKEQQEEPLTEFDRILLYYYVVCTGPGEREAIKSFAEVLDKKLPFPDPI